MTELVRPTVPRTPWRALDAVFALVFGFFVSGIAYAIVAPDPTDIELFGLVFPAQWAGTFAIVALLARHRLDWRVQLRVAARPRDLWGLPMGAGLQIGFAIVVYLVVVVLLGSDIPTQPTVETASSARGGVAGLLVVLDLALIGPVTEEIVFRGILLRSLERRGRILAIVVSSLSFAVVHLLGLTSPILLPVLFVLGAVMAYQTLATGRLGRAVAIHIGFNLVTLAVLFLG